MTDEVRRVVVGPGRDRTVRSPIGGEVTHLARGEQTGGALAVLEVVVPAGEGPPLHRHTREEETIYVLEGSFRWRLGDEIHPTPPGGFVFVPRGLPHCFQNVGDTSGRLLITFAPAGMERFFDSLAEMTAFHPEAFRRAGAERGMEVLGPRLSESDPVRPHAGIRPLGAPRHPSSR